MISLASISPGQAENYYQKENYYSKDDATDNSGWWGSGAKELGLSGPVGVKEFKRLISGKSPDGRAELRSNVGDREQRAGLDLTLSAPKSVSLLALVHGDASLERAHRTAVERTLEIVEARYSWTRTGSRAARQIEVTGKLIVGQFHHDTSRQKDPQLHTHCVILNVTKRADGNWRSLHNDGCFNHSKLIGLIYQNELARECERLGYTTVQKDNATFEIAGYSREHIEHFSTQSQKIAALGCTSRREEREAKMRIRPPKGEELSRAELQTYWRARTATIGMQHPRPTLQASAVAVQTLSDIGLARAVESGIRHASSRDVEFSRAQLEQAIFEFNLGRIDLGHLSKAIDSRSELIATRNGKFTTLEAMTREAEIHAAVGHGKKRCTPILSDQAFRVVLPTLSIRAGDAPEGIFLTPGQRNAVIDAIRSQDQFIAWQGVGGSGKSYSLNVVRKLAEAHGSVVRGFAQSAKASAVLGREAKLKDTATLASLLAMPMIAGSARDQIWIVDEAGLVGASDMHALIARASIEQARVILVGDTHQLAPIEAGMPFKGLQKNGIQCSYLEESLRQKTVELKQVVEHLQRGQIEDGLRLMGDNIKVIAKDLNDPFTLVRQVVSDYIALPEAERSRTMILAGTNATRKEVVSMLRFELKREGKLASAARLNIFRGVDLTTEQRRYATAYTENHYVVPRYTTKTFEKNTAYKIAKIDAKSNKLFFEDQSGGLIQINPSQLKADLVTLDQIEIGIGEKLRWTKNDKSNGIRNGEAFVVESIHSDSATAQIRHENGIRSEIALSRPIHADSSLVTTVYSAQGDTIDNVLYIADGAVNREAVYTAISRAKYNAVVYVSDKENFFKNAQKTSAKANVTEVMLPEDRERFEKIKIEFQKNANKFSTEILKPDQEFFKSL